MIGAEGGDVLMKSLHIVAMTLVWIGALNWGVWALTGWEVGQIFGGMDAGISKVIYVLVGLAAIYTIFDHKKSCRYCGKEQMGAMQ